MIDYIEHRLSNGLHVVIHPDPETPLAVLNLLYRVGSKDEHPEKTGIAHLFEHLMFGGSRHLPKFDRELQRVGAENNAFTNCDITNYYTSIPAQNIETAFWAESDRMANPLLTDEVLDIQRSVVVEEFRQRYLNQPYGDVWHHLRPLAYERHPYRWPTIGVEPAHIEKLTADDILGFYQAFYRPSNAILVVAGNVRTDEVLQLCETWFGDIPDRNVVEGGIPEEPTQNEKRFVELRANVPLDAIWKVYHIPGRTSADYYSADLLGDILGRGKSSRLYKALVKEEPIFTSIQAYSTSNSDPGLLVITGKINPGISPETADMQIEQQIGRLLQDKIQEPELEKVKNQAESTILFSETELLNRAIALAQGASLGHTGLANEEIQLIRLPGAEKLFEAAGKYLRPDNCSTLYYLKGE